MDIHEDMSTKCLGRWVGGKSFSEYTEVDIFVKDDTYHFRRINTMPGGVLESTMTWDSAQKFRASIPLWTQIGSTEVRGTFQESSAGLVLDLEFENDGMGGAEPAYVLEMTQDVRLYNKFQNPSLDITPSLSSGTFPVGAAHDVNLTPDQLASAVTGLMALNLDHTGLRTDGIMLLKDGHLIAESYQWGMDAQSIHLVASVTKSVVGIMVGIAVDQGHTTLTDIVSDAFPELKDQTTWHNEPPITLHHALSMTSGAKFGDLETQTMLSAPCVQEVILSATRLQNPGERFRYDNGLSTLLALFLERKTGMTFEKFAEKYFFGALGITRYRWSHLRQPSIDGSQMVLTSGGLFLTVPDMAKIGQLMLDRGVFNGKRVLSESFIKLATTQHTPLGFFPYGYHWHLNAGMRHFGMYEDAYMALGAGENVICVIPSQRIVFVAACSSWSWPSLTPPLLTTFCKSVLKGGDRDNGRL